MKTDKIIKSFPLQMKDMDDKTGQVAFYFAAFDKDLEGDIIEKSAYSKTLKENFSNLYHNRDHTHACGVPMSVEVDNKGAFCLSQLALKTVVGLDTYEQYKAGIIKGHSQEFQTIKDTMDMLQKARVIKELRLWGVTSVTNIPANLDTPTISIKSFQDITKHLKNINDILHKGNISDRLGEKFAAEYVRLKAFIDSNPEILIDAEVEKKSSPLITDDFIGKIKLFD